MPVVTGTPEGDQVQNLRVWLRFEHSLAVRRRHVADLLTAASAPRSPATPTSLAVDGRDLVSGQPRTVELPVDDVLAAAATPVLPW